MEDKVKLASKYYIEAARLLGIYSHITGDVVVLTAGPPETTEVGVDLEISEDMIIRPVEPSPNDSPTFKIEKASFTDRLAVQYSSFKVAMIRTCKFHETYVISSTELHKEICEALQTTINLNCHFPRLLTMFMSEHPQYPISKKRTTSGMTYYGLSLRSLSEVNRKRLKRTPPRVADITPQADDTTPQVANITPQVANVSPPIANVAPPVVIPTPAVSPSPLQIPIDYLNNLSEVAYHPLLNYKAPVIATPTPPRPLTLSVASVVIPPVIAPKTTYTAPKISIPVMPVIGRQVAVDKNGKALVVEHTGSVTTLTRQ